MESNDNDYQLHYSLASFKINFFCTVMAMEFLKLYLDYLVFGVLACMSITVLTLVVERYIYFYKVALPDYPHRDLLSVELTKNLTGIASIAANGPYVGLLGTVLGILLTFHEMGQGDSINANQIMLGLALALKATAAGLAVAIPATVFYNALQRKVEVCTARWDALDIQQ